jgi:hypothetical protein
MISFRVKIANVWQSVSPIFNDFKIKKSRDKEQIFQIRTSGDGLLTFFCPDYEKLVIFAGSQLELEITEKICNNIKIYDSILNVAPEVDVFLKKITATVVIKDEYYSLFDKVSQDLEFDEDFDVRNAVFSGIRVADIENKLTAKRSWDLNELISFLFNQIDQKILFEWAYYGVSQTPAETINSRTLIITNENNIRFFNDATETNSNFFISLKTLLDLLLKKFFIGWYLIENDGAIPNLSHLKYFVQFKKIGDESDFENSLIIEENKFEQNYKILSENDFSSISYKTFDFDETITNPIQSNFCSVNVKFDVQKNNKKEIPINCEVFLPKIEQKESNKIVMFECTFDNNYINLKNYQNQFYNSETQPFDFASGDGDLLTLRASGVLSRIFWPLPENVVSTGIIKFYFRMTYIYGSPNIFLCQGTFNNYQKKHVENGVNFISFDNHQNFWIESETDLTIYEFEFISINFTPVQNSRYGIWSQNFFISTFGLILYHGANLPKEIATYKVEDINEYIIVGKSKKEQQTILFKYQNTMNNLNFFHKVKTALTTNDWWFVYEAERIYGKNYSSYVKLTLNR